MINEGIINKLFSDNKLNKDERYMILMLKAVKDESENKIVITLNALMEHFESRRKIKIINILKSLESKGYIEIIKTVGKSNSYRFTKDYLLEKPIKRGDDSSSYSVIPSGSLNTTGNDSVTTTSITNVTSRGTFSNTSNDIVTSNEEAEEFSVNTGREQAYSRFQSSRTGGYNIKDNNINNYIYNNKLYKNILNTWNKTNINNETNINLKITEAINSAAKNYKEDEILKAIENYSKVYYSQHYYNHRWNLVNFMIRPNGVSRFLDSGDMWLDYKSRYYREKDEFEDMGIDIENYID